MQDSEAGQGGGVGGGKGQHPYKEAELDLDRKRAHHRLEAHRDGLFLRSQFPAYFL